MAFKPEQNPFDRARLECCPPEFDSDTVAPTIPEAYILAAESRLRRRDPVAYAIYRYSMGQLGYGFSAQKELLHSLRSKFNLKLHPGLIDQKRWFAIRFMRRRLRLYLWRNRIIRFARALCSCPSRKELP